MADHDQIAEDHPEADEPTTELDREAVPAQAEPSELAAPRQPPEDAAESLRELVVFLVENLVDNPGESEVVADQHGSLVQIRVRLPEAELGKVIGRGGRIAKAIRTSLMIAGSRHHLRVSLDIES